MRPAWVAGTQYDDDCDPRGGIAIVIAIAVAPSTRNQTALGALCGSPRIRSPELYTAGQNSHRFPRAVSASSHYAYPWLGMGSMAKALDGMLGGSLALAQSLSR